MATVIIHSSAFPRAGDYYQLVPWQVVGPTARDLAITNRVLQPNMTLHSILQALSAVPEGGEAVIVAHGVAGGLSFPLTAGTETQASVQATDALQSTMATEQHSAEVLRMPVRQLRELRELARGVRARRLAQIDFRACNLGATPYALESLKRLMGPQRMGAPRVLNAYGHLESGVVMGDATAWSRWMSRRPNAREYSYGPDERIALAPRPEPERGRVDTIVSSSTVMVSWVQERLARGRPLGQGPHNWWTGEVPYHAAYDWHRPFPMIWPGDYGYVEQIVYV